MNSTIDFMTILTNEKKIIIAQIKIKTNDRVNQNFLNLLSIPQLEGLNKDLELAKL